MKKNILKKLNHLKKILKDMQSVVIAYSGGVDSSLLLKIAKDVLKNNVLAVTANSATYPKTELNFAKQLAKRLKVRHRIIYTQELNNPKFTLNPINRCYYCKKELFSKLTQIAKKYKLNYIADGTNFDDLGDMRFGSLAAKEFSVRSPLEEANLRKKDIREISYNLGLVSWDKPSFACLASRFPYRRKIKEKDLKRVDKAEEFIRSLGFAQVRVRDYGDLARIEVEKKFIPKLSGLYSLLSAKLKRLGYTYVTLDLEGYRQGSMNLNL